MFTEYTLKTFPQMAQKPIMMQEMDKQNPPRVFAVDPFASVYQMRDGIWALAMESGDGHGYCWCYLIDGPQKAMLINTAWGIGDLNGLAKELTGGKDLIVVCSWPHKLTATGNFQFDRVYCHEYAVPVLEKLMSQSSIDYMFDEEGQGKWLVCDRSDAVTFRKYDLVPCEDGFLFDLGDGREFEVIWTPGMSPGGISLLDKEKRNLFTCAYTLDQMSIGVIPRVMQEYRANEFATIPAFVEGLLKLQKRMDEFDTVFSLNDVPLELPRDLIPDWIRLGKMIIENPEAFDNQGFANSDHAKNVEFMNRTFKGLTLTYNKKSCVVTA